MLDSMVQKPGDEQSPGANGSLYTLLLCVLGGRKTGAVEKWDLESHLLEFKSLSHLASLNVLDP